MTSIQTYNQKLFQLCLSYIQRLYTGLPQGMIGDSIVAADNLIKASEYIGTTRVQQMAIRNELNRILREIQIYGSYTENGLFSNFMNTNV